MIWAPTNFPLLSDTLKALTPPPPLPCTGNSFAKVLFPIPFSLMTYKSVPSFSNAAPMTMLLFFSFIPLTPPDDLDAFLNLET